MLSSCPLIMLDTKAKELARYKGFPGGSDGKEYSCNAGDPGSSSGSGRSLGKGNRYPFQYSYLENSMNRGAWKSAGHD